MHSARHDSWSQTKDIYVFVLLLLFSLLVRFPFFFPAVIDWDESTQILMGQSIIDGHLPYVTLWDNKPPGTFAFYALLIALFGRDLVGIRFGGTLCVVVTAFLVYLIGNAMWTRRMGLLAAILCVVVIGVTPSGQATMTEHLVLLPLMSAVYLLIRSDFRWGTLFLVGLLLAASTLVRENMAFVVVAVGLYLLFMLEPLRSPIKAAGHIGAYIIGGLTVIADTWIPYKLAGQDDLLWTSVISAPLSYAGSQYSLVTSLNAHIKYTWGVVPVGTLDPIGVRWLRRFLLLTALAGVGALIWRWQNIRR